MKFYCVYSSSTVHVSGKKKVPLGLEKLLITTATLCLGFNLVNKKIDIIIDFVFHNYYINTYYFQLSHLKSSAEALKESNTEMKNKLESYMDKLKEVL